MSYQKRILTAEPWFNYTGFGCWECGTDEPLSPAGVCYWCRQLDAYIGPQPHLPDPYREPPAGVTNLSMETIGGFDGRWITALVLIGIVVMAWFLARLLTSL